MHNDYSLKDIEGFVTISQSQFDDLKIDTGEIRVWLSRMTIEDGQPYNNQITIERYEEDFRPSHSGKWVIINQYEAK